ncbi:hypothetical protein FACS1894219_00490 [Clostridia bacterium]|nr:hypothetical protein FACS1894219_00490 [Clostridia bacterium]
MLIITRRKNDSVVINDNIEVTIADIQGDKVRIGIDAPECVKIMRKELLETEKANKEAASSVVKPDLGKLRGFLRGKK